jgi:hypothetical protein
MTTVKKIFCLLTFLICVQSIGNAQAQQFKVTYWPPAEVLSEDYNIDTLNIPKIRQLLDTSSTDSYVSGEAALFLAERGYSDIIPKVKMLYDSSLRRQSELGWKFIKYDYLIALYVLHDPDVPQLVNAYIDTMISIFGDRNRQCYSANGVCTAFKIVACLGDYSRFDLFNDLFDRDRDGMVSYGINLLNAFGELKEFRPKVFQRLKSLTNNPGVETDESIVYVLRKYTDFPETQTILRQIAMTDKSYIARDFARDELAWYYKDPFVITAAVQTAKSVTDTGAFKSAVIDIEYFPSPMALVGLNELKNNLPPGYFKDYVSSTIEYYKPAEPPESMSVIVMVDSIIGFVQQCGSFSWIGNQSFVTQLEQYIIDSKIPLIARDSVNCARKIKLFQQSIDKEYEDTLNTTSNFVTKEGWKFLYYNAQYILDRLPRIPPPGLIVKLVNSTGTKLTGGTLQYYEGSWKDAINNNDGTFSVTTNLKTISLRMTYEYGTQTKSNVSISNDTIVFQTVNAQVQLQNSSGTFIDTGSVQYYAGAWRNLGTTINGTATKELLPANYSFRMTYAYASKDKQQDLSTNATVVFQTVNAVVQLQNNQGSLMPAPLGDQGTVQYYSGVWRNLGTTTNGVANKELLPANYSFRMTYAYASKDKQQDISTNSTVVFQTVNAAVQLKNSLGTLIDQGTVQYYSGAWRDLGVTTSGIANKELLPNNYSFRMNYAFASKDKQQDISTNAIVVFQTVNAAIQLQNSQGTLMPAPLGDQGTVQYYSGAWRTLGTTTNGTASKELLPNNYSFRMTYAYASKDKQQDIGTNATVVFQTVNTAVQLKNSLGNLIDQGTVQYYSGTWRDLGTTTNGAANKELLPNNYSFRMTYEYVSLDKAQDISTNNIINFSTVLCTIRVKNSQNQLVNNAMASYYSGAWRQIGNTVNGVITKELLPVNLSFRVKLGTQQQDKQQNLSTNTVVEFSIP